MTSTWRREAMIQAVPRRTTEPRPILIAVAAALAAATAAGWVILAGRMAGMDSGPGGDPGALGWFTGSWAVMTAAMMLPASAPLVPRLVRAWPSKAPAAAVLFFAGYGAVWMLAGLAGYALVAAVRALHLSVLAWSSAGRYVAGGAVVAAGVYQLSGAKRRSLARCVARDVRRPHDGGIRVALLAGVRHGACCVACSWMLMAALYALGMMSITWMVVITVLIATERVLPHRKLAVRGVAAVLVVLGIAMAGAPGIVPALTVPHTMHAMPMGAMHDMARTLPPETRQSVAL